MENRPESAWLQSIDGVSVGDRVRIEPFKDTWYEGRVTKIRRDGVAFVLIERGTNDQLIGRETNEVIGSFGVIGSPS